MQSAPPPLENTSCVCYFNGLVQVFLTATYFLKWESITEIRDCMSSYFHSTKVVSFLNFIKILNISPA